MSSPIRITLRDGATVTVAIGNAEYAQGAKPASCVWLRIDTEPWVRTRYTRTNQAAARVRELDLGGVELGMMIESGGIEPRAAPVSECHHLDHYDAHGRGD